MDQGRQKWIFNRSGMKNVRRIIAVLLVLLLSLTQLASAVAEQEEDPSEEPAEYVARIYICTRFTFPFSTGHAWVYIENLTDRTLQVGLYELPPEEGVSIGSYGITREGFGVYYNVESFYCNTHAYRRIWSLQEDITQEDLDTLNEGKLKRNYWGIITYNCMGFAFSVWNAVARPFLVPLLFPILGFLQILMHGGEVGVVDMTDPGPDRVYRVRGKREEMHLEQVSYWSLHFPIG